MSSRASESYIVAIDTDGRSHFVAYEYDYSSGYYRSVTCLGDRKYEIECDGYGEYSQEEGQKLPHLESTDLTSYFTEEPTQTMRRATALAGLKPLTITQFVCVTVHLISWLVTHVSCTTISATEETNKSFVVEGVPEETFGKSVEVVATDILEKGIDGYAAYLDSVRQK